MFFQVGLEDDEEEAQSYLRGGLGACEGSLPGGGIDDLADDACGHIVQALPCARGGEAVARLKTL